MKRAVRLAATHWYVPAFLAIVAAVWLLARQPAFMAAGGEAALLIDLCLTAPVLYILCYARKQPLRVTIIRALAITFGGIWLASWLIPGPQQVLLPQLAAVRWLGSGFVIAVELLLLAAALRIAFSGAGTAADVSKASGAPAWVARIMLWEANLWRGLWRWISGKDGRQP